ncbi:MAG: hypothetical protein DRH50_12950 [Deltaproteobacteria bacterium]|nr:MAG: hypothetical protein DRH50_12950 [Deltaproteobacteria bacterium]
MQKKSTIHHDTTARHLRKYSNRNPIHQFTLGRFFNKVADEVQRIQPENTLEFGCGEGLFLEQLKKRNVFFPHLTGIDLRKDSIVYAQDLHPEYSFQCIDLFDFKPKHDFDLVIASQVLEHLIDPEPFLGRLVSLSKSYLLLTVPWEPWFQLMNLLRGRDVLRLGNHPEHVNQWTVRGFKKFVSQHAELLRVTAVFPFIIILAEVPT